MKLSVFTDEVCRDDPDRNISPDAFALADPDLSALEANTWRNLEFTKACLTHAR